MSKIRVERKFAQSVGPTIPISSGFVFLNRLQHLDGMDTTPRE